MHGLKQVGYNWFVKFKTGLRDRDFIQSSVDLSVVFSKGYIVLIYADDCIIARDTTLIAVFSRLVSKASQVCYNRCFGEMKGGIVQTQQSTDSD